MNFPGQQQHFEGRTKSEGRQGPEIFSDGEGDPIGQSSNKTKTANRYRKSVLGDTAVDLDVKTLSRFLKNFKHEIKCLTSKFIPNASKL